MQRSSEKFLTGKERVLERDEIIVTKTDITGKIRYANRTFYKYGDYTPKECIGTQHNIVRNPEMPRTVFKLLWDTIAGGSEIFAYVNNRAKNGDNYWVLAHVTPNRDASGQITGYHSNRRAPSQQVLKDHIKPLYRDLLEIERRAGSPKAGLQDGEAHIRNLLSRQRMTFNEFIFSLGV